MSRRVCDREEELLDLMRTGRWPACCDDELAAHLSNCSSCVDVIAIAPAVMEAHDAALSEAHVPPSGVIWWRAQRRARETAMQNAMRVVTAVQGVTITVAAIAAVSIFGAMAIDWSGAFARLNDVIRWTLPAVLVGVACLALAPVALYFAIARDR